MPPVPAPVSRAAAELAAAGVDCPRVDAELLAAHVLGVPRSRLALVPDLSGEALTRYRELVRDRSRRVPLQHLTGTAPFRHLELAVGPGVFVPRPETEPLVSWGLELLAAPVGAPVGAPVTVGAPVPAPIVVDLCSGSGAIALAVAQECPTATVYAVERSAAALDWLRRNAARRAVPVAAGRHPGSGPPDRGLVAGGGVVVVEGDAGDPEVLAELSGRVDLVLCNPPYVPDGTPLPAEVARFDPPEAVFAGPDGLDVIRPVIRRAAGLLRPGGGLGIEHDDSQAERVTDLLRASGRFGDVIDHRDLAGRPRFGTARRLADCTT